MTIETDVLMSGHTNTEEHTDAADFEVQAVHPEGGERDERQPWSSRPRAVRPQVGSPEAGQEADPKGPRQVSEVPVSEIIRCVQTRAVERSLLLLKSGRACSSSPFFSLTLS